MKLNRIILVLLFTMITVFDMVLPVSSEAELKFENGLYVIDNVIGKATMNNRKKSVVREEAKRYAYSIMPEKILSEIIPNAKGKENYELLINKVSSKISGLVKNFHIDSEQIAEDGTLTISGTCKIDEKTLDKLIGSDVIKIMGNPRIMLYIDEKVGGKSAQITHKQVARIFEKAGYVVVTPDQVRTIINIDSNKVFSDPKTLYEVARTLRADVIVIGKASAAAFATKKYLGATFYGVSGSVQLKAIITQTSQEITSQNFSSSTGRKPAGSLGEGASRCLTSSAARAAEQILYKIAYGVASSGANLNDITINIKIANILFNDVEKIETLLRELAGKNGEMFERSYRDNLLEIVFTSKQTSREVASFLSEHGLTVKTLTNWSIDADMFSEAKPNFVPDAVINVIITEVPSFKKSGELENLLSNFIRASNGRVVAKYQDKTLELLVSFSGSPDTAELAKNIAAYLEENKVEIEGASPSFVKGKLKPEEEKRGGLLW